MGANANALLTYGDVSRREDVVMDLVEILTAQENFFLTTCGKTQAIDTVHSFLTDTLLTPASLATEMGTDITVSGLTTPSRLTNIVEQVEKGILVSRQQEKVQHYHGQNETERQISKGLKDWGNAAEFDLVRSTLVSGLSGTVAKMNGVIAAISKSTNTSVQTSGTVYSATILDAQMSDCWTNSNGDVATDLVVGGVLRRVIDGFTQKTNIVVNNPDNAVNIVKTVSSYETAFGTLMIHKHRFVYQSGDATNRALGVRPEKLKIAYLDQPFIKDLAEAGSYTKKLITGSMTLEVRNQDSNFWQTGFLLTA